MSPPPSAPLLQALRHDLTGKLLSCPLDPPPLLQALRNDLAGKMLSCPLDRLLKACMALVRLGSPPGEGEG